MPPWMTSLLREEMPVPMAPACSATTTSWPCRAAARATAKPTTPAPITRICMRPCVSCENVAAMKHPIRSNQTMVYHETAASIVLNASDRSPLTQAPPRAHSLFPFQFGVSLGGKMRNPALFLAAGILTAVLASPAVAATTTCHNHESFEHWVTQFKRDAVAAGISQRVVAAVSPELNFDPSVLRRDRGQAVFNLTFVQFANRLIGGYRMPNGRAKMKQNAALFAKIERVYGVPPEVLTAMWGLESDF